MMPGIDPRMMKQAMKRMGIKQEEIEATEVIIRCPDKEIVVSPAAVQKINMMGEISFQVNGTITERDTMPEPELSEDDIQTVMDQANVTREAAMEAIEANEGDLAAAILSLKKDEE
jgi:nascent polypeptide-associated complex subunit alpha